MELTLFILLFAFSLILVVLGVYSKTALIVFIGFGLMFVIGISMDATGITRYVSDTHITDSGTTFDINNFLSKQQITKNDDDGVLILANFLVFGSIVGMVVSSAFIRLSDDETILEYGKRKFGG